MAKIMEDGWHKIGKMDVYVEDGYICCGSGYKDKTVYPYKRSKTSPRCFDLWQPKATYYNAHKIDLWV